MYWLWIFDVLVWWCYCYYVYLLRSWGCVLGVWLFESDWDVVVLVVVGYWVGVVVFLGGFLVWLVFCFCGCLLLFILVVVVFIGYVVFCFCCWCGLVLVCWIWDCCWLWCVWLVCWVCDSVWYLYVIVLKLDLCSVVWFVLGCGWDDIYVVNVLIVVCWWLLVECCGDGRWNRDWVRFLFLWWLLVVDVCVVESGVLWRVGCKVGRYGICCCWIVGVCVWSWWVLLWLLLMVFVDNFVWGFWLMVWLCLFCWLILYVFIVNCWDLVLEIFWSVWVSVGDSCCDVCYGLVDVVWLLVLLGILVRCREGVMGGFLVRVVSINGLCCMVLVVFFVIMVWCLVCYVFFLIVFCLFCVIGLYGLGWVWFGWLCVCFIGCWCVWVVGLVFWLCVLIWCDVWWLRWILCCVFLNWIECSRLYWWMCICVILVWCWWSLCWVGWVVMRWLFVCCCWWKGWNILSVFVWWVRVCCWWVVIFCIWSCVCDWFCNVFVLLVCIGVWIWWCLSGWCCVFGCIMLMWCLRRMIFVVWWSICVVVVCFGMCLIRICVVRIVCLCCFLVCWWLLLLLYIIWYVWVMWWWFCFFIVVCWIMLVMCCVLVCY